MKREDGSTRINQESRPEGLGLRIRLSEVDKVRIGEFISIDTRKARGSIRIKAPMHLKISRLPDRRKGGGHAIQNHWEGNLRDS